jgi:hypothetical protein
MAQFNFSAAYLVGTHEYYTSFSNRIEPYFKNQKSEVSTPEDILEGEA